MDTDRPAQSASDRGLALGHWPPPDPPAPAPASLPKAFSTRPKKLSEAEQSTLYLRTQQIHVDKAKSHLFVLSHGVFFPGHCFAG